MGAVHDSVSGNLEELKSQVTTLINCDIKSSTRWAGRGAGPLLVRLQIVLCSEIAGFRTTIESMLRRVSEISTQVGEINRNRENNLLIHGLPTQEEENLDSLIKLISDLVRTRLGIGREIALVDIAR